MKLELLRTVRVRTSDSPRVRQRIADKRRPARYGLRGSASTSPRERQAVEWTAALCPISWGGQRKESHPGTTGQAVQLRLPSGDPQRLMTKTLTGRIHK